MLHAYFCIVQKYPIHFKISENWSKELFTSSDVQCLHLFTLKEQEDQNNIVNAVPFSFAQMVIQLKMCCKKNKLL